MSSCLIIQNKNKIYVGSDTALSFSSGSDFVRSNVQTEKIFKFDNGIMFCSGNMKYVEEFIEYTKNKQNINLKEFSCFLKEMKIIKQENIFQIEVMCFISGKHPRIYQISEYNNFDAIEWKYDEENTQILSCGLKTVECLDIAEKEFIKQKDVQEIFTNTFNKIACNQIGGCLGVWEVGEGINKLFSNKISDSSVCEIIPLSLLHSLVADVVVGRLLAGNQLTIANEGNTFTLDGAGATLTNATMTINTTSGNSKILLDPTNGIKIQGKVGGSWADKFYVDTAGNVFFTGNLTGATGTFSGTLSATAGFIGGWTINSTGLSSGTNYINNNGYIKLGMLTITPTSATFSGAIYASNLQGQVQNSQIASLSANKISAGTIYGSTISWSGGTLGIGSLGYPVLTSSTTLGISGQSASLFLGTSIVMQGGGGSTDIRGAPILFTGNIYTDGYAGQTIGYSVQTPYGTRVLTFRNGLLIGYT